MYASSLLFINLSNQAEWLHITKLFELIIAIRVLKITTLFYEIRMLKLTIETMRNLTSAISNLLVVVATLIYVMSLVGSYLWGGKVTTDNYFILSDLGIPQYYSLVNFNDMLSSVVTCFILLVVNDWPDAAEMFVDVSD